MSSGNSIRRGGINVSAYLENLNTLPPPDERIDDFNPADLDIWTNTQFFDFDPINQVRPEKEQQQPQETKNAISIDTGMKNGGNFDQFLDEFNEFENFDYSPTFDGFNSSSTAQQMATPVQQVMPAPVPQSPGLISSFASASTPAPAPASQAPVSNARGTKRKASVSVAASSPGSLEEASRLAAEEDKRRRNTAASARFRVKKKQKEQQLEKTAKEMTDRVHRLEQRIQQLELENKWLKGLIVEKNGGKAGEEMMMPPSMLNENKDGVGTTSSANPKPEA